MGSQELTSRDYKGIVNEFLVDQKAFRVDDNEREYVGQCFNRCVAACTCADDIVKKRKTVNENYQ